MCSWDFFFKAFHLNGRFLSGRFPKTGSFGSRILTQNLKIIFMGENQSTQRSKVTVYLSGKTTECSL